MNRIKEDWIVLKRIEMCCSWDNQGYNKSSSTSGNRELITKSSGKFSFDSATKKVDIVF